MSVSLGASAPVHPSIFTTEESSVIKQALSIIEVKRLRGAPILYYFKDFQRYLVLRFAGLTNEQGHVLYLDINRRLLSAETEFFGHQSAVTWDMRKVVMRAITLGAEYVVFAHNHPSENPDPSDGDLRHLQWSEDALRPLNINLLDSYVVTSSGITSIKDYSREKEEEKQRRRMAEYDRLRAERSQKIRAGRARKAAERAARAEMEVCHAA